MEGRIRTRKWQDKSGVERYATEIEAVEMNMLGGKLEHGGAMAEKVVDQSWSDDFRENGSVISITWIDDGIPF